jgi:hypothetical protein
MRTLCTTLALALLVACGGDNSNSPKTLAGSYTLNTVGGHALPAVVFTATNYTLEVTAGTVALNGSGSFTDSYTLRENDAGTITTTTIPCNGSWTQTGSTITLTETVTSDCGDTGTATWDGSNRLTINWDGLGVPAVHIR